MRSTLTGMRRRNVLTGGAGGDTIDGGLGADTLDGGAGNDTITYDGLDVSIAGGADTDTLLVNGGGGDRPVGGRPERRSTRRWSPASRTSTRAALPMRSTLTGDGGANVLTGGAARRHHRRRCLAPTRSTAGRATTPSPMTASTCR